MSKNFLWGILLFVVNFFILFQNYSKNFVLDADFFMQINQMCCFILGMLFANQYRKFNLKHISAICLNCLLFSLGISFVFGAYTENINYMFSFGIFVFEFSFFFLGYSIFYMLFCPKKRKRKDRSSARR